MVLGSKLKSKIFTCFETIYKQAWAYNKFDILHLIWAATPESLKIKSRFILLWAGEKLEILLWVQSIEYGCVSMMFGVDLIFAHFWGIGCFRMALNGQSRACSKVYGAIFVKSESSFPYVLKSAQ